MRLAGTLLVLLKGLWSQGPAKASAGHSLYPLSRWTWGARLPIVPSQAGLSWCSSNAC